MNAVDTNILLYSIDRNEPAKQLVAQQLLQQLRSGAEPRSFSGRCSASWPSNCAAGAIRPDLHRPNSRIIFRRSDTCFRWRCPALEHSTRH